MPESLMQTLVSAQADRVRFACAETTEELE